MLFLNDFRTFRREDLSVDFSAQLQAYSTVHLLFSDIASMGTASSGYDRRTKAIAALDKLSNLISHLFVPKKEEHVFKRFFGAQHRDRLLETVQRSVGQNVLGNTFVDAIQDAYDGLVLFYAHELRQDEAEMRAKVGDIVRMQRNLHHGAYLRAAQFEKLFLTSSGRVAEEVTFIAFVSVLCFALDPVTYARENDGEWGQDRLAVP